MVYTIFQILFMLCSSLYSDCTPSMSLERSLPRKYGLREMALKEGRARPLYTIRLSCAALVGAPMLLVGCGPTEATLPTPIAAATTIPAPTGVPAATAAPTAATAAPTAAPSA